MMKDFKREAFKPTRLPLLIGDKRHLPSYRCNLSQFISDAARREYFINDAFYGTVWYPTIDANSPTCYNGYPQFLEHLSYGDLVLHPRVQTSGAGDDGREHFEGHPSGRARRRQLRAGHNEFQQRHHRRHTERRVHRPGDDLHEPAGFRGRFSDVAAGHRGGFPRRRLPLCQGARRGPQERRDRWDQLRPSGVRDRELQRAESGVREGRQLKRRTRCAKSKKKLAAGEKEEKSPLRRIVDG